MSDEKEKIKQEIAIELENARLWSAFLLPSIGLALALFFTNRFFPDQPKAKVVLGTLVVIWILYLIIKRNECLANVNRHLKKPLNQFNYDKS